MRIFIAVAVCFVLTYNCRSQVTDQQIKEKVAFLTSDELMGRQTGSEGIEKAATYIETVFKTNHIQPYFETYRDSFNTKGATGYNMVGFIEGHDPDLKSEIVVLGAHYDHIGFGKKVGNDSIANGANDNAAGTSAVLALAKYFATLKNNKRSIIFALFSGEEMGLLGSKQLATRLKEKQIDLYTMINFEMIGVPFKDRDYTAFVTGYDLSNMASVMNTYMDEQVLGKSEVAVQYELFKRSDNYPFYEAFQVPCQTISSCDLTNFDFYHHVDDEADKMDYDHMANLINTLIPAIEKVCSTPTKEIKMTHE